jgi:hypothetical protein
MIKVYSNYYGGSTDITSYCKSVQWSGDKTQCARRVDITLAYAIFDTNQPKTQISPGTIVWVVDDTADEIFRGVVFDRSINSNQELKFTAYDFLIYFLKSKMSFNFTNMSPEAIAAKVCGEVNVPVGNLASTGLSLDLIAANKTLYDIIMQAYSFASLSNGKQYFPTMSGGNLNVIEKGQNLINFTVDPYVNIDNSEYSDNIDTMINKVKVYKSKEDFTGEIIENTDWQNSYGILQNVYTVSKNKDTTVEASLLLKGVEQQLVTDVVGNVNVITGTAVKTHIFYVNVLQDATWYVDGDVHTWEIATGKYTMRLTLESQNIMDLKGGKVDDG